MAILRPSKTFEGGDLSQKSSNYIKSGTRTIDFRGKENGVYLFLLGAYKLDVNGNGVWYKPLRVRDNFGLGMYKEKFAIQPNCPIDYFASKVMTFAPEMGKAKETVDDAGRKRFVYPAWGRTAFRVIYNSAIFNEFNKGVHVLDLPQNGGASVIDEYVRGKQPDGTDNPLINNYEAAIPLNIKLDLKAQGQPWKILINSARAYPLPPELADTDYLYNLEEIVTYPDKDELIEKLRSMVPSDIFFKGMDGYPSQKLQISMANAGYNSQTDTVSLPSPEDNLDMGPSGFESSMSTAIPKATPKSVAPSVSIPRANAKTNAEPAFAPAAPNNSAALAAAAAYLQRK